MSSLSVGRWAMLTGVVILAAMLPLRQQTAEAAPVLLIQQWEHEKFANNGRTIRTGARYDDGALIGIGNERFLLNQFNVISLLNGAPQSSEVGVFTSPPSLSLEGNIFAEYIDGVFLGLSNVDLGGSARIPLVEEVTGVNFGNNLNIGNNQLVYWIQGLFQNKYRLVSSEFITSGAPTPIPLPAAFPLLAAGLAVLGLLGWRRNAG